MAAFNIPYKLSLEGNVAQNWKIFIQQFEIYLIAAKKEAKADKIKISLLLNFVSEEAVGAYNTFTIAEENRDKYALILQAFENYCKPKKNQIIERYKFNKLKQQDGETIEHVLTSLKKAVKNCEYEGQEKSILRDRVVYGIKDATLREKLLETDKLIRGVG
ncbi:uncharacterized protein LOC124296676 [Neodiprion virginianus]|uniref:uncharacterized protein LOC124296676 n=1 Tax=Neodiprion virginianus TaxID=2961670 RepID=UPI001EE6F036|nr:uncharacterized protein LOC124296676 [Neodiprion virginianus]